MILGKQDIHMQRNETGPLSYSIYKNQLKMYVPFMYNSPPTTGKWIKDLNVRLETVKPLVRDIGERLLDISLDNNFFFGYPTKNTGNKAKMNKWTHQPQKLLHSKRINEMDWKKVFVHHGYDKRLI
jgi:hypothetical protein